MAAIGNWGVAAGDNLRRAGEARGRTAIDALNFMQQGIKTAEQMEEWERKRRLREAEKDAGRGVTEVAGEQEAAGAIQKARAAAGPLTDEQAAGYDGAAGAIKGRKAGYQVRGRGELYGTPEEAYGESYSRSLADKGLMPEALQARGATQALRKGNLELQQLGGQVEDAEHIRETIAELRSLDSLNAVIKPLPNESGADYARRMAVWSHKNPGMFSISVSRDGATANITGSDGQYDSIDLIGKSSIDLASGLAPLAVARRQQLVADLTARQSKQLEIRAQNVHEMNADSTRIGAEAARTSAGAAVSNASTARMALGDLEAIGDPFLDEGGKWKQRVSDKTGKIQIIDSHDPALGKGGAGGGDKGRFKYEYPKDSAGAETGIGIVFDSSTGRQMPWGQSAKYGLPVPLGTSADEVDRRFTEARAAGIQVGTVPVGDEATQTVHGYVWAYIGADGKPYETLEEAGKTYQGKRPERAIQKTGSAVNKYRQQLQGETNAAIGANPFSAGYPVRGYTQ